ncbi:MAG: RluA family pseudouridine synthase [Eubacteriales bacterium]|nr:RluA family pseudouridine synthase [Eubacteriales bacterium]
MAEIVYEDNHLLIAVKPPNVLTQSDATGDESFQEQLKAYVKEKYQKPGEVYLGLVHRMDRPVGGLVAFARTGKAAARLSEQLREHRMEREYLAVVQNPELPDTADLRDFLLKDEKSGNVKVVPEGTTDAREARLSYTVLERQENTALIHVRLETGRKHQIRVQLMHFGHPIVYDMRYGQGERGQSIALWGAVLHLDHPTKKERMTFTSSPAVAAFEPYQRTIENFLQSVKE